MTVVQFRVPRLDAADRILSRLDLSPLRDGDIVNLMREAGYAAARDGSRLTVREQLAFLVNSLGELETLNRLLELVGESGVAADESAASVEFQVRLTEAVQRYEQQTDQTLPPTVTDIGFRQVGNWCTFLDVQIHPWVDARGTLFLQWRRDGCDHVATVSDQGSGPLLTLMTTSSKSARRYDPAVLERFLTGP